jgi:hypothetical protein
MDAAAAPARPPPELAQVGKPDAAEAERLLAEFQRAGVAGPYYLEFELQARPRRGEGPTFRGRLWGARNAQGAVTRVELTDSGGAAHRFLMQNGPQPAVWRQSGSGGVVRLDAVAQQAPLVPGVEVTAFDVQMPFLYWPGAIVEKITRVLGRPANAFLFRAPGGGAAESGAAAARAYLDTQYNQLLKTEVLGADGRVTKTFSLVSLKKVGEQYVPKEADYRNELTRDKTRLLVTGAALGSALPADIFEPATLAHPGVPPGRVVPVEP